jgi:hypothetical protein
MNNEKEKPSWLDLILAFVVIVIIFAAMTWCGLTVQAP